MAKEKQFKTSIGGQALIEGIMMRGPEKQSVVVRTPDGLVSKVEELKLVSSKHKILGRPFIRGVVNFVDSLVKGMQALTYSAELQPEEEQDEPGKLDLWIEKHFGWEAAKKFVLAIAVIFGIVISVGLFMLLPTLLAGFLDGIVTSRVLRNLLEGALRIIIFLLYLWLVSRMNDIRRVFEYHGAEHKTIHCYEKRLPLTVENVRTQPRQHPRCGTSFLFVVMIVSILVFSVVSWSNPWIRMGLRIVLLPVVVGISYEINRLIGRHDNRFTRIISAPGRALQNLTTREPDDSMIEVGIAALELVTPDLEGADSW